MAQYTLALMKVWVVALKAKQDEEKESALGMVSPAGNSAADTAK